MRVELELDSALAPAGITLVERFAKLGERRAPSSSAKVRTSGRGTVIPAPPRGRYTLESAVALVEDPFGLERAELALPAPGGARRLPRGSSSSTGCSPRPARTPRDGRRLLLQRPSGFDLHSVRDYVEGDSLRKVHWATTARRGHLMVKELEDAPRDELAVVLDAHRDAVVGESFDVQVRVAGSIVQAYARRGRRAALVLGGATLDVQRVQAEGDWRRALELLAAGTRAATRRRERRAAARGRQQPCDARARARRGDRAGRACARRPPRPTLGRPPDHGARLGRRTELRGSIPPRAGAASALGRARRGSGGAKRRRPARGPRRERVRGRRACSGLGPSYSRSFPVS